MGYGSVHMLREGEMKVEGGQREFLYAVRSQKDYDVYEKKERKKEVKVWEHVAVKETDREEKKPALRHVPQSACVQLCPL